MSKENFLDALNEFYSSHILETVDDSLQIFRSFTYGEMVISFLLLSILFLLTFKFIYEVLK